MKITARLRNWWRFDPHGRDSTGPDKVSMALIDFCRRYNLPYIHGCIWDRRCRFWAQVNRISLHWRGHMWWVDLPGNPNHVFDTEEGVVREHGRDWRFHFSHSVRR